MKLIKKQNAMMGTNTNVCKVKEYDFNNKLMDLGIAEIKGRYPDKGYCQNQICTEIIYVIKGHGKLYINDEVIELENDDAILINPNEKYYYETDYMKIAMICSPAFDKNQYVNVN